MPCCASCAVLNGVSLYSVWLCHIGADCRVFHGQVLEVLTGDTIVVAESTGSGDAYEERKVSFSSIR